MIFYSKEKWSLIDGYGDKYKVSNLGRVINEHKSRVLSAFKINSGYLCVSLYLDGKSSNKLVHRLVAAAFIPNHGNKPHINHIDFDRTNNAIENIEWCSPKENSRHSYSAGRFKTCFKPGSEAPCAKLNESQVVEIRERSMNGEGDAPLSRAYGVTPRAVKRIRKRETWKNI
jgi:hypothetical protein